MAIKRNCLPVRRIWVKAGLGDFCYLWVAALPPIEVVPLVVTIHVTHPVLLLLIEERVADVPAVPAVEARQGVVAFGVAVLVPDLADVAVGQDEPVAEGGVPHLQHLQLPGDVVAAEGLVQVLVLELDLLLADGGVLVLVVVQVHHAVAHGFVAAEPGQPVVAGDDVRVVTHRLPAERRVQAGVQQIAVVVAELGLRAAAVLHGRPGAFHIQ